MARPTRAERPRVRVSTRELLTAVHELGPHWPRRFAQREIVDVNEALDRELIAGTLSDAITLSPRGHRALNWPQDEPPRHDQLAQPGTPESARVANGSRGTRAATIGAARGD